MLNRSAIVRQSISVLLLLVSLSSYGRGESVCDSLEKNLDVQKNELEAILQTNSFLDGLFSEPLALTYTTGRVFSFALDDEFQVSNELNRLAQKTAQSPLEALPAAWSSCSKKDIWQAIVDDKQFEQARSLRHKKYILSLPQQNRQLLQIQLTDFVKLSELYSMLVQVQQPPQSETTESNGGLREQLIQSVQAIKYLQEQFLVFLINDEVSNIELNQFWLGLIREKSLLPQQELPGNDFYVQADLVLHDLHLSLIESVTQWRNLKLKSAGWGSFMDSLLTPSDFFQGFLIELKTAPKNFLGTLSDPFVEEYVLAEKNASVAQQLTSWVIQFAFLLLMIAALIKSAGNAASWLADVQQSLLKRLESSTAHSLLSGLFWMLKPNASWVFILVVANITSMVFPDAWLIAKLIAPLATIYASFRALRIIIEWGLSRTYTRSGIFLSNQTAEQLIFDSRKATWILVFATAVWSVVYATGGAYLSLVLSLGLVVCIWVLAWWTLAKHEVAVNKLIFVVLNIKQGTKLEELNQLFVLMNKIAWPLVFAFVQLLDVSRSLNQKMMVFDVYRSFSVKLLRVRLESKAEDALEDDDGEPDENYSDWMLREAPDSLLFDVGDVSSLLDPIKSWYAEKTDENVMVIVGESGSGKSTLVRRLPGMWKDTPVKVLDIPPKMTVVQDLYDNIAAVLGIEPFTEVGGLVRQDERIEPKVVVIDSAHNLFLAEVGMFDAYKALLRCMNAHLANVFWVVVMHAPSWTYLNYVFVREQRISNVFKMPRWSPMDIRKLILSRHQGGRRRLRYNEMLLSAAASSESSSVRAADSRVFNILWEQCGGNPLAAIELWLNAVKVKGRVAEVGVPQRPSANLLNGLKDDLYFVYTAIVSHSSLSTNEIMQVTHFTEPVVRHALKQGINLGMITRDETKRYTVDPYWYGTLSGFLHRKNMLWG